jgi:hypothetical protein
MGVTKPPANPTTRDLSGRPLTLWHYPQAMAAQTTLLQKITTRITNGLPAGIFAGIAMGIYFGMRQGVIDGIIQGLFAAIIMSYISGWLFGAPPKRVEKTPTRRKR